MRTWRHVPEVWLRDTLHEAEATPPTRKSAGTRTAEGAPAWHPTTRGVKGAQVEREVAENGLADVILQATASLIEDEGIDAVTMRAVAKRIGYSPTTIYLYFQNKDELLKQALVYAHGQLLDVLREAAASEDLRERLARIGVAFVRWGVERPKTYQLIFEHGPRHHDIPAVDAASQRIWQDSQRQVAQALDSGLIRRDVDPGVYTQLLWATLHGIIWLATTEKVHGAVIASSADTAEERAVILAKSLVAMVLDGGAEVRG